MCQIRLKLSCNVNECKPLTAGGAHGVEPEGGGGGAREGGRGLHSSTFQLNVRRF